MRLVSWTIMTVLKFYDLSIWNWIAYFKETDYRVQEWVRDERMPNWIFDEDKTWHFRQKKVTVYLQKVMSYLSAGLEQKSQKFHDSVKIR